MSSIVFDKVNTSVSIMVQKVNLQFAQTQVVGQTLKKVFLLTLLNIAAPQYKLLYLWVVVYDVKQVALSNRTQLRIIRVVNYLLVEIRRRLNAVL